MHLPSYSSAARGTTLQKRLEAAIILKGVVKVVTAEGEVAIEPRTWYRESGEHVLEARRRDSGEQVRLRVSDIREVTAY
jgi:hypothetical protein